MKDTRTAYTARRSTYDVLASHLQNRVEGRLNRDLAENYAEDVVLMTVNSHLRGKEALRVSADRLAGQLPNARFTFVAKRVDGDAAFLVWRAESDTHRVECGADTFLIRDGRIVLQTIHYSLLYQDGRPCPVEHSPGLDKVRKSELS